MILKIHKFKVILKRKLINLWYWLMKPIAYFFTPEREDRRYKKKKSKITEDQALRLVAKEIAKYVVKHGDQSFMVAEWFDKEYFYNRESLRFARNGMIKNKKARIGYYKLKTNNTDVQLEIIRELNKLKGIEITKEVEEFSWEIPRKYVATFHVKSTI